MRLFLPHLLLRTRLPGAMPLTGIIVLVLPFLPLLFRFVVENRYGSRIYTLEDHLPDVRTAIVFGAAVRNGYPSTMLRDRLDTAIRLYHDGQVSHLVMSGGGDGVSYDEPAVMARYASSQGVPLDAITLDRSGLRTYDTCYRANRVFGLEKAVLVTQSYHLPRALFTCEALSIDAIGVSADRRDYRSRHWYNFRELLALTVAGWDVLSRRAPGVG